MTRTKNKKAPAGATAKAKSSTQLVKEGKDTMNTTTQAITVPFHGANLVLVEHNGQPYTPMKPIVEGMGLAWKPQFVKLQDGAERFGVTIKVIPVSGAVAKQETLCMPLRKLPGWLMSVSPNRVKDKAVRDRVIHYQNECDDALWDYWTKGEAINPRLKTKKALPHGLTLEQQDVIKAMVRAKAETFPSNKRAGATIKQWSAIKSKFGCSYKEIEPQHFTEVLSLLARIDLEGELLPKQEQPLSVAEVVSFTELPEGSYLVNKRFGETHITNVDNCSMVPLTHVDAVRRDMGQLVGYMNELAGRINILRGEVSPTRLATPLIS